MRLVYLALNIVELRPNVGGKQQNQLNKTKIK